MENNKKKSFLFYYAFTSFSVLLVFLGVFFAKKIKNETIGQNVDIIMDDVEHISRINFLVLGLDGDGSRSDTIIFMSYDNRNKTIKVLSIPRDTRVKIGNTYQKINAAIGIGRQEVKNGKLKEPEELSIKKVKEIIRLPIHFFITVDFKGFRNIVDILGGVDFNVPDVEGSGRGMNYEDPYQHLKIHLKPGLQHLDGVKAEQLVRYRKYNEADLARIKTQQQFIKELAKQKLRAQYLTKVKVLYEEIKDNMRSNYTLFDLTKHMGILRELKHENIENYQLPGEAKIISGIWYFLVDTKASEQMINEHFRS